MSKRWASILQHFDSMETVTVWHQRRFGWGDVRTTPEILAALQQEARLRPRTLRELGKHQARRELAKVELRLRQPQTTASANRSSPLGEHALKYRKIGDTEPLQELMQASKSALCIEATLLTKQSLSCRTVFSKLSTLGTTPILESHKMVSKVLNLSLRAFLVESLISFLNSSNKSFIAFAWAESIVNTWWNKKEQRDVLCASTVHDIYIYIYINIYIYI